MADVSVPLSTKLLSLVSGNITITQGNFTPPLTIGTAPAAISSLSIAAGNSITVASAIAIGGATTGNLTLDTTLLNSTSSNIALNNNLTANGGMTLIANGAGTIGGAGTLNSTGAISLTFGTAPLAVSQTASNVFITQGATVLGIGTAPSSIGTLSLTSGGNISTTSALTIGGASTGILKLTTNSGGATINIANAVTANGGIALTTFQSATGSGSVSSTGSISISIGAAAILNESSGQLSIAQGTGTLAIGTPAASVSSLALTSAGNISASSSLTIGAGGTGSLSLTSTNGNISLPGGATANGAITLSVTGTGTTSVSAPGLFSTGPISLNFGTNTVTLGTSSGLVTLSQGASSVIIGTPASSINALAITAAGNITTSSSVSIGGVNSGFLTLDTSSGGGNITLANAITANGTLTLSTSGSGIISSTGANAFSTGNLNVNLGPAIATLAISGGLVTITQGSATLTVGTTPSSINNLTLSSTGTISLGTNVAIGGASSGLLSLSSNGGSINIANSVTANGGLNISTTGAGITSGAGSLITAGTLNILGGSSGTSTINAQAAIISSASSGASLSITQSGDVQLNAINEGSGSLTLFLHSGSNVIVNQAVVANGGITIAGAFGTLIVPHVAGAGSLSSTGAISLSESSAVTLSTVSNNIKVDTGTGTPLTILTSPAFSTFALSAGPITLASSIDVGSSALSLTSSSSISLGSDSLTANGGLTLGVQTGGGPISSSTGTINSTGPISLQFGSAVSIGTSGGQLTFTQGAAVLTVGTAPSAISSLSVTTSTNITTSTAISVGGSGNGTVNLTSNNGTIALGGDLTANGGITLDATSGTSTVSSTGVINSPYITIRMGTDPAIIGLSSGQIILTQDSNVLTIGTSPASISSFSLKAGSISTSNPITIGNAGSGTVALSANTGSITLSNTLTAATGITLTGPVSGTINSSGVITLNLGNPPLPAVSLGTVTGQINITNGSSTLLIANSPASISQLNITGGTSITVLSSGINLGSGSVSLVPSTNGSIQISGNVTANGGISLGVAGTGTIGGAGTLNSTGPIEIFLPGTPVTLATSGSNATIIDGATSVLIAGNPSILQIDSPTVTINSGTTFSSPATTLFIETSNFVDNGTLTSATSGSVIQIGNSLFNSTLTLSGNPQPITNTSPNGGLIEIISFNGQNVAFNSSYTLNAGAGTSSAIKITSLSSDLTTGSISLAAGQVLTLQSGTFASLYAPTVTIGTRSTLQTTVTEDLRIHTTNLVDNGTITSSAPGGIIRIDDQYMNTASSLTLSGTPNPITNTNVDGGSVEVLEDHGTTLLVASSYWLNGGTVNGSAMNPACGSCGVAALYENSLGGGRLESTQTSGQVVIAAGVTLTLTGGNFTEIDAPRQIINPGASVIATAVPVNASNGNKTGPLLIIETKHLTNNGSIISQSSGAVVSGSVISANIDIDDDDTDESPADADNIGSLVIDGKGSVGFAAGTTLGHILIGSGISGIASRTDSVFFNGNQTFTTDQTGVIFIQSAGSTVIAPNTTQTVNGAAVLIDGPMFINNGTFNAANGATITFGNSGGPADFIENNGLISCSTNTGSNNVISTSDPTIQNPEVIVNLTLAGANGTYLATGTSSFIRFQTLFTGTGVNTGTINVADGSVLTFTNGPGSSTSFITNAFTVGLGATLQNTTAPSAMFFHQNSLVDNGNITSSVNGGTIAINNNFVTGALTLSGSPTSAIGFTGGASGTVTIQDLNSSGLNVNSAFSFNAGSGQGSAVELDTAKTLAIPDSGSLTLNGSTVTINAQTIQVGTTLGSPAFITSSGANTFNIVTIGISNAGLISSTVAGGAIHITNAAGAGSGLTLGNTGINGLYAFTGGASGSIAFQDVNSIGISILGNVTIDPGANGSVSFNSPTGQIDVSQNSGVTFVEGQSAILKAPTVQLGSIASSGAYLLSKACPTVVIETNILSNDGTITSNVNGGSLTVSNNTLSGGLTLTGNGGSIAFSGVTNGGSIQILEVNGAGLNINAPSNFDAGAAGGQLIMSSTGTVAVNGISNSGSVTSSPFTPTFITGANFVSTGTINVGTQTLTLAPVGNSVIAFGGALATAGAFNVTASALQLITASKIIIGTSQATGGINLTGSVTLKPGGTAGSTSGIFDLDFENGGAFNGGTGNALAIQGQNLTIRTAGALTTGTGGITGTIGTIFISGGSVNVNGSIAQSGAGMVQISGNGSGTVTVAAPVTIGSGGTGILITNNTGSIVLSANIGNALAPTQVQTGGGGTISQTAGTLFGSTIYLQSASGDIFGALDNATNPLRTSTGILEVNTTATSQASAYLTNAGSVMLAPSTAGKNLEISTSGAGADLTVSAQLVATNGLLQLSASGNLIVDQSMQGQNLVLQNATGTNGTVTIANSVTASAVSSITVTTAHLINSGTLSTTGASSSVTVLAPSQQNLLISGTGTITSGSGGVTFTDNNANIEFAGSQNITGNTTMNALLGAVQIDSLVTVAVTGNATVNAGTMFNTSGLTATGTITLNINSSNSNYGTILAAVTPSNPNGDLILTSNMLINTNGKSLALIAPGNIYVGAGGLPSIDLYSVTGSGGNLTALAGVNYTPSVTPPSGQCCLLSSGPSATTYQVTGASTQGGSINLPYTTILTSSYGSTAGHDSAGRIVMVANQGSNSSGSIVTGPIYASSVSGDGGNVTLIAPGGVVVGGPIVTTGLTSGGSVTISGGIASSAGSVQVLDGIVSPSTNYVGGTPVAGSGMLVNGFINTSSASGSAGSVSIIGEGPLQVNGFVYTVGTVNAGSIQLTSTNNSVSVFGFLNASGNNIGNGANGATAGNGGAIAVHTAEFATIYGFIDSAGGYTVGGGNGGAAGSVILQTSSADNGSGLFTGNILVTGYINAAGGTAYSGGIGGAGNSVTIQAGAVQVLGAFGFGNTVASIVSSGGSGAGGNGASANISIDTYAVQDLPANFNLLAANTNPTEFALPGAIFNTGTAGYWINGTAGSIVTGTSMANSVNAGILTNTQTCSQCNQTGGGTINITVHGNSVPIVEGTTPSLTISPQGNVYGRRLVSPGEAVALYQASLSLGTQVQLNSNGQVTGPSVLTVPEADLPTSFAGFVLPAQVQIVVSNATTPSATPILNLSSISSESILGSVSFPQATMATVISGAVPITVGTNASIISAGILSFENFGAPVTNDGTLQGTKIAALSPYGQFVLINNSGATINGTIVIPSLGSPAAFVFYNNTTSNIPVLFQPLIVSANLSQVVSPLTIGAIPTSSAAVYLSADTTASIGGTISAPSIVTITSFANTVSGTGTPLSISANSNFAPSIELVVASSAALTVQSGSAFTAPNAIILSSTGSLTDNGGNSYTANAPSGVVEFLSSGNVSIGSATSGTGITSAGNFFVSTSRSITVNGATGSNSAFTSTGGLSELLGPTGITVTNLSMQGQYLTELYSAAGSVVDNGGSNFSSPNGIAYMVGTAVTLGGSAPSSMTGQYGSEFIVGSGSGAITVNGTVHAPAGELLLETPGAITVNGNLTSLTNSFFLVTSATGAPINLNGSITMTQGEMLVQTAGAVSINGTLQAGATNAGFSTPLNPATDIKSSGFIDIMAGFGGSGNITFGNTAATSITASGGFGYGNIFVTNYAFNSGSGKISFSPNFPTTVQSNGGNVEILAKGTISGAAGNTFIANGLGTAIGQPAQGGGLELGSGTTVSSLAAAQAMSPPGQLPQPTYSPSHPLKVTINNQSGATGVLQANATNGGSATNLDLATSGSQQATITLHGGAFVVDLNGAGASVQFDGGNFTVDAFRPVAFTYAVSPAERVLSEGDENDDHAGTKDTSGGTVYELAHLFTSTGHGAQLLSARKTESRNTPATQTMDRSLRNWQKSQATWTMHCGEIFAHMLRDTTIKTPLAVIHAQKGALLNIAIDNAGVRVTACSGPGDVSVLVSGKTIAIGPGQELLVSNHAISPQDSLRGDGIGRRFSHAFTLGAGVYGAVCDVSLGSMLNNSQALSALKRPASPVEKNIAERLLKTAAALSLVTQSRGSYTSRTKSLPAT